MTGYHLVCRDCTLEEVLPRARAARTLQDAHQADHPDHDTLFRRVV